jgi:hypothetical protein
MNLRDALGWRHLKRKRRAQLDEHTRRVEALFRAFEETDPDGLTIVNSRLEDLAPGRALQALAPDMVASTVIASVGVLRRIPVEDKGRTVRLLAPSAYRRHFAAQRILAYGAALSLPFSATDVALLFDLALTSGNIDPSLHKVDIRFGPEWTPFAANSLIDQIYAEIRLPLFQVAVGAAEGLLSSEFGGEVADQLVRSRKRLQGVSVRTFEVEETLDQIDAILARPLGFGEPEGTEPD